MKTKNPIQAQSTNRIIKAILPPDFKMVNNIDSNGYKFINLVFGNEVDEANKRLQEIYDNSFLSTIDLSQNNILYEVGLSGIPHTEYLNATNLNNPKIKITDADEFDNGYPTRLLYNTTLDLYSGIPQNYGSVGLEYFREDLRGSGYFILNIDLDQEVAYISGIYPSWKVKIDSYGTMSNYSGFYPGIGSQNFDSKGVDEILTPETYETLKDKYPQFRKVIDQNGTQHLIDHYEPNPRWTLDQSGVSVAINDYGSEYYFNDDGEQIFYKTLLNNPYGSGNYSSVYLDLLRVPIDGSLKLYDIDILNKDGDATEIPQSGITLYTFQSPNMLKGTNSGIFDPVYVGYDSIVPENQGFGTWAGTSATPLTTISWDYVREGAKLNNDSHSWIDGSGILINKIKINNPRSRFLTEYKYKQYNKSKFITSTQATNLVKLDVDSPTYSIDNSFGNLEPLDYEFTKNPKYITSKDERSKILTFDGLKIRPNSFVSQIDLSIPYAAAGNVDNFPSEHVASGFIGFSADHVPVVQSKKIIYLDCKFDSFTTTETDYINNYTISYSGDINSSRLTNYNTYFGKLLKYNTNPQEFKLSNVTFFKDNTFYQFGFNPNKQNTITLLEMQSAITDEYLNIYINDTGNIITESNGYKYYTDKILEFDSIPKELIIRRYPDDISPIVPKIEVFLKTSNFGFKQFDLFRSEQIKIDTTGNEFTKFFKNCSVITDYVKIYTEAY